MGYTGYNIESSINRNSSRKNLSDSSIKSQYFNNRNLDSEIDIKNKIRECRDLEGQDPTFPIIISLDVTGSMGYIPIRLIKSDLNTLIIKILESGVKIHN